MKRPLLLIGTMLGSMSLSWLSFQGIDVAAYGVLQIVLFATSTVIAGYSAFKGFSSGKAWAVGFGCLTALYIVVLIYLITVG